MDVSGWASSPRIRKYHWSFPKIQGVLRAKLFSSVSLEDKEAHCDSAQLSYLELHLPGASSQMEAPGTHTFYNFPFCFPLSKSCLNSGTHSRTHCPLLPQTMYIYVFLFVCFCFFNFYLFIYLFMAVLGLRFCARAFSSGGKRGHSSSRCAGLSLSRPLLLRSTGSRRAGSAIVAHRPSCSVACGIVPDQGSNPCPLH